MLRNSHCHQVFLPDSADIDGVIKPLTFHSKSQFTVEKPINETSPVEILRYEETSQIKRVPEYFIIIVAPRTCTNKMLKNCFWAI